MRAVLRYTGVKRGQTGEDMLANIAKLDLITKSLGIPYLFVYRCLHSLSDKVQARKTV